MEQEWGSQGVGQEGGGYFAREKRELRVLDKACQSFYTFAGKGTYNVVYSQDFPDVWTKRVTLHLFQRQKSWSGPLGGVQPDFTWSVELLSRNAVEWKP